jgi:hypothetical protein
MRHFLTNLVLLTVIIFGLLYFSPVGPGLGPLESATQDNDPVDADETMIEDISDEPDFSEPEMDISGGGDPVDTSAEDIQPIPDENDTDALASEDVMPQDAMPEDAMPEDAIPEGENPADEVVNEDPVEGDTAEGSETEAGAPDETPQP